MSFSFENKNADDNSSPISASFSMIVYERSTFKKNIKYNTNSIIVREKCTFEKGNTTNHFIGK